MHFFLLQGAVIKVSNQGSSALHICIMAKEDIVQTKDSKFANGMQVSCPYLFCNFKNSQFQSAGRFPSGLYFEYNSVSKTRIFFHYLQNFFLIICIPIINIGVSTGTIWTWLWWCHKSKLSPSSKGRRLKLTFHCPMEIAMAIPGLHQLWVTMEVMPKWQRRPGHSWRFLRINVISTWRLSPLLWMAIQKFSYGSGF